MQEQGKEETRGSASEVLERLRRNVTRLWYHIEIEEEEQPPGEPAQVQGKEETRGSGSKVLEGLHRKIE